jgi:hypothetical protein
MDFAKPLPVDDRAVLETKLLSPHKGSTSGGKPMPGAASRQWSMRPCLRGFKRWAFEPSVADPGTLRETAREIGLGCPPHAARAGSRFAERRHAGERDVF